MKKPIHVLHTFANNDGVPYITWFMKRAKRDGTVRNSFLLMCAERPKMIEEIRGYGFQVAWIPYHSAHRKRGMLLTAPWMWWHMMRWRPDIVQGHLFEDSLPAMLAARLAFIRGRLVTRQDTGFHLFYAPKWVFIDRLITKLATRVVAVSGEARELMITREQAPPDKVCIVHHGIDPEPYRSINPALRNELKEKYRLEHAFPIVGTVARLIEWKGYRHIIEAASRLVKRHPRIHFLFCGTGDQEEDLRKLIAQYGLEQHITFTGWVERSSIPALFGLMDVYLHAADHEPFGFVLAEAMMAGAPVVATRTGGIADVAVDGESVIFVKGRNGQALAEGVERAMQIGLSSIGDAGRQVADRSFTFDRMWNGYMVEYLQALSK